MASFNKVVLVGNLTRDVEMRYISSGTAVTEVTLAINSRRKNQAGEWVEETNFIDVTLWGRQAEVASEYLSKGSSVLIEGHLKLDTWEKDGKKNYKLKVIGENMQMLGGRGGQGGSGGERGGNAPRARAAAPAGGRGGDEYGQPSHDEGSYESSGSESRGHGGATPPDDIPF